MSLSTESRVMFFRLNTGEDIVSESQNDGSASILLTNPLKVVYSLNEMTGRLSVSLIQWVFPKISDRESFVMNNSNILIQSPASLDMTGYYYKSLEKIATINQEPAASSPEQHTGDDEGEEEDVDDEIPDYIKEKIEEVMNRRKKMH